jgi:hypothetical protein
MYVCTLYSTYVYSLYMYIAHISITAQIVHEQCVLALSDDPSSYPICASWRSFLYLHYFSQVGIGKKPAAPGLLLGKQFPQSYEQSKVSAPEYMSCFSNAMHSGKGDSLHSSMRLIPTYVDIVVLRM